MPLTVCSARQVCVSLVCRPILQWGFAFQQRDRRLLAAHRQDRALDGQRQVGVGDQLGDRLRRQAAHLIGADGAPAVAREQVLHRQDVPGVGNGVKSCILGKRGQVLWGNGVRGNGVKSCILHPLAEKDAQLARISHQGVEEGPPPEA